MEEGTGICSLTLQCWNRGGAQGGVVMENLKEDGDKIKILGISLREASAMQEQGEA